MPSAYYQILRSEIVPLLPAAPARILEIGSGAGTTLAWLKRRFPDAKTVGLDGLSDLESDLAANADIAIIHDLEQPLPELGRFDLILAMDVLEHLRDPDRVLQELSKVLDADGTLIVSLPNLSHISVSGPLLFGRHFQYKESGILDRTHLRFFVEETAVGLLNAAGFEVVEGLVNGFWGLKARALDVLTLGAARPWMTKQYIMKARKRPASFVQRRVSWGVSKATPEDSSSGATASEPGKRPIP